VPAPAWRPTSGGLPVIGIGPGAPRPVADPMPPRPGTGPSISDDPGAGLSAREGCACATVAGPGKDPAPFAPVLLLGLCAAASLARRRRRR
jgi:MYXO-CTERM domain-containing protein